MDTDVIFHFCILILSLQSRTKILVS